MQELKHNILQTNIECIDSEKTNSEKKKSGTIKLVFKKSHFGSGICRNEGR